MMIVFYFPRIRRTEVSQDSSSSEKRTVLVLHNISKTTQKTLSQNKMDSLSAYKIMIIIIKGLKQLERERPDADTSAAVSLKSCRY